MTDAGMPSARDGGDLAHVGGGLAVVPVTGIGEVLEGTDLAAVLLEAADAAGHGIRAGDCVVVSSKVVSKSLGLRWTGSRADAVAAGTVRVVAERRTEGGVTRVVESVAGPVMAAAGVDASNTGPTDAVLLLPPYPDEVAAGLRSDLLARLGAPASSALGVVLSDTAGRPWRQGLVDLALGAAGLRVVEDLRGHLDHDGRPLAVTTRALADEVAAAADLVKGKADGIPAAVVRGLPASWFAADSPGARSLVRTGAGDWFALGHVEAVRAALGAAPGTAAATEVGVPPAGVDEPLAARVARVVALALHAVPEGSADVGVEEQSGSAQLTLGAPDEFDLGRLVTRFEVAAHSEGLRAVVAGRLASGVVLRLEAAPPGTGGPAEALGRPDVSDR